ncbi:MAG: cyanophycinase [Cytophagales bacterium]|nr:MAG: cyanophycinase [Cytophagales bacterium]
MKKSLFLLSFLFFCLSAESQNLPKGKLFIIGGGKRPPEMLDRMLKEAQLTSEDYIVILPLASEEPDSAVFYAKKQFANYPYQVVGMNFSKENSKDFSTARLDSIRKAKLIYCTGGDQNKFMGIVKDTELEKALREAYQIGALIAGTSAGAAMMSEKMITGNEKKYSEYSETFQTIEANNIEIAQGMAFLKGVIIDQHFLIRSRHNRLFSAILEYPDHIGIGIDEATAILVTANTAEVVGNAQVILFRAQKAKIRRTTKDLWAATGIQIDILVQGDTFSLKKP